MPMQNAYEYTFGNRWTYTTYPGGRMDSKVTTGQRTSFQRYSVASSIGDYVNPRAHQYALVFKVHWNGMTLDHNPWVGTTILTRGILSRTTADTLPSPFTLPASVYNKAYAEMVEKIRGSTDLSIDLIQWRQAVQMVSLYRRGISGFAEKTGQIIKSIDMFHAEARRRYKLATRSGAYLLRYRKYQKWYNYNLRKTAQDAARARLEYVYGWQPLASSIIGLGEVMSKHEPLTRKMRARGKESYTYTESISGPQLKEVRRNKVRYRCEIQIKVRAIAPVLSNLARISSLNPASVAYEAFPFSFVGDWFINIGGWLRNVETAFVYGSAFQGGHYSYGYYCTSDQDDIYRDTYYLTNARAYVMRKFFVRLPLGYFPMPRFPSFEMDLGVKRSMNALALATVNASRIDDFVRNVLKK